MFKTQLCWELVGPVVADPVTHDNDEKNYIQIYSEISIFMSCRYRVELGPQQLGLPVAE